MLDDLDVNLTKVISEILTEGNCSKVKILLGKKVLT